MNNPENFSSSAERESVASQAEIQRLIDIIDVLLAYYSKEAEDAAVALNRAGLVPLIPTQGLNELYISRDYRASESGHKAVIKRVFDRPELGPGVIEKQRFYITDLDGQFNITASTDIYDPQAANTSVPVEDLMAAMELEEEIAVLSSECNSLFEQISTSQPW